MWLSILIQSVCFCDGSRKTPWNIPSLLILYSEAHGAMRQCLSPCSYVMLLCVSSYACYLYAFPHIITLMSLLTCISILLHSLLEYGIMCPALSPTNCTLLIQHFLLIVNGVDDVQTLPSLFHPMVFAANLRLNYIVLFCCPKAANFNPR